MIETLALPEVRELLDAGDLETLAGVLNQWHPADLAALLGLLSEAERVRVVQALEGPVASQVFGYVDLAAQERLLEVLSEGEAAAVLEGMAADDRTALLEALPEDRRGRLIGLLSAGERAVAESLLRYEPDTVGRLMTPDYVAVRRDWTIRHVLEHVRTHGKDSETLNVIYVVDDENRLVSDLRIRSVLLAPPDRFVRDLIGPGPVALKDTQGKEEAVASFRKYDRTALPVTDAAGRLVGVVTVDDVLDVAEEEATREIQQFGGLEALDTSYVATPLLAMTRKRSSWLVVLFLSEMLTATAMGHFEGEIARLPVLALFLPLIISSGGNSGSQAATLIIRALALGELRLRDFGKVFTRELCSGLLLGGLLGTIGFLRIAIWSQFTDIYTREWPMVALVVGLSLVGVVLWGSLCGSMLPFLLKRLGFDPATSSAPFVATLVDVTGIVIYFSVAYGLLRGRLL